MRKNIRIELNTTAPVERVWSAITDKAALTQWFMVTHNFEDQVGSDFMFEGKPHGRWDGIIHGSVLESNAPRQLVYTFTSNDLRSETVVRWVLSEDENRTGIVLEHTGFKGLRDYITGIRTGLAWRKHLHELQRYLEQP